MENCYLFDDIFNGSSKHPKEEKKPKSNQNTKSLKKIILP
jgi:hypothetical protein